MAAQEIPAAIFTESYLSFLGLGVSLPMPSLGSLANAARSGMQSYPLKLVFPAVAIILIVLSFNLLGLVGAVKGCDRIVKEIMGL